MKLVINSLLIFASALVFASCTNSKLSSLTPAPANSANGINNLITSFNQFTITGVTVNTGTTSGSGSTSAYPVQINFPFTTTSPQMTNDCSTNGLPCLCKFSWSEANTTTNPPTTVQRAVYTNVTLVQSYLIGCTTPASSVWLSEIPVNTSVAVTVVAGAGNTNQFTVSNYNYIKGMTSTSGGTGSITDNQGNSYYNIDRYSCYEQSQKGTQIMSRMSTGTDTGPNSTSLTFPFPDSNKFCFYDSKGQLHPSSGTGGQCSTLSSSAYGYTSQANYFNFYIRDSEKGNINPGNSAFTCPTVKETLNNNGNIGTQNNYWPLDSTFALSLIQTASFNVGVEANSQTANGSDPTAQSATCSASNTASPTPASSTTSSNSAIISSCLGYAAPPNTDGTCPSLTTSGGSPLPTYRLRRYISLYPPTFDTSGASLGQPQQVDTVYVLDRPVNAGTGNNYTMRGPKPCPFAYFDKKGVTSVTATAGFVGTNDVLWNGKNVDGLQFPNSDSATSCTAVLPLPNAAGSAVSLATIPTSSATYIRPIDAWAPHYEEDTGFQACAPLASPYKDPPLHFAKDINNNVSWCAEAYPTQDDNVAVLDPSPFTNVKVYTSHVVKNSSSPACVSTSGVPALPAGYSTTTFGGEPAYDTHSASIACDTGNCDQTCDRTTINPTTGISWAGFPLLAPPADVEEMLSTDTSYNCSITYDNAGASNRSVTKVNSLTPSQGCCGVSTNVWTGPQAAPRNKSVAHLEPLGVLNTSAPSSCAVPNY